MTVAVLWNPDDTTHSLLRLETNDLRLRTNYQLRSDRLGLGTTPSHKLHIASTSASEKNLFSDHTLGDIGANGAMYSIQGTLSYRATDIATQTNIGGVGIRSVVNVGSQSAGIAATGSVLGVAAEMYVSNNAQAGAEHAPMFGVLRYDNAQTGRAWLTDYTVHGAIATQQQILTGVNVVLANYYNGQPSENPSCAFSASAGDAIGGSLDVTHGAATRYPGGVGFWVGGRTQTTGRGFDVGFQVGGGGGPWGVTASRVGKGGVIRDYDTAGIHLLTRNGSTAAAIQIDADAGPILLFEQTAPSAPAANGCYLYTEDNGAGKTRLMALFNTGAAQQVAIQP